MSEIPVKLIICVFKIISRLFSNRKLGCHRIHDDNTEIHIENKNPILKNRIIIDVDSILFRCCRCKQNGKLNRILNHVSMIST